MLFFCKKCSTHHVVNADLLLHSRRVGLEARCPNCASVLERSVTRPVKAIRENVKRSQQQEARVAKRESGKRQAASGSRPGYEGDVRKVGAYRGECKFTRAKSFTLKLEVLKKLEMQANYGELPVLDLEFQGQHNPWRYVVLPEWAYEMLMKESGRRGDHAPHQLSNDS